MDIFYAMNTVCKCNQTGKNYDRITEKLRDRRQNSFPVLSEFK